VFAAYTKSHVLIVFDDGLQKIQIRAFNFDAEVVEEFPTHMLER
jgi:hypothetical protein